MLVERLVERLVDILVERLVEMEREDLLDKDELMLD
jgi:hypothetical protein